MKKPLKYLVAAVIVLVVGGGIGYSSAVWARDFVYETGALKNGPWQTNLAIGSEEAGIYTRAAIAKHGLLALTKTETLYYGAAIDDDGEPLLTACDYRIEGKDLDARWWSITAYGKDDFLIPNDQNRYAYGGNEVTYDADGCYRIYLSATPKEGCWLPTGKQDKFDLTLRVYNPGPDFYNNPGTVELPRIIKEEGK